MSVTRLQVFLDAPIPATGPAQPDVIPYFKVCHYTNEMSLYENLLIKITQFLLLIVPVRNVLYLINY